MTARKHRSQLLMVLLVGLALVGTAAGQGGGDKKMDKAVVRPSRPLDAKVAFERLKTLRGVWVDPATAETKQAMIAGRPVRLTFDVAARGSAVTETFAPESAIEMMSVYYLVGTELQADHFCSAGNQPRFKLNRAKSTERDLLFEMAGGTNLERKPQHMGSTRIRFVDENTIESSASRYDGKKFVDTTTLTFKRVKE